MVALGRRLEHDPRSLQYPARRAVSPPRSVLWRHDAPVLDQADLGSCTGHALAQCLNTTGFAPSRPRRRYLTSSDAVRLYSAATHLDPFPGEWPPQDTGSSGLAVAKAGVQYGYLSGYRHAFGFAHFVEALALQPVIIGTNWYTGMFSPNPDGIVDLTGQLAGGHEYLALGVNFRKEEVTCLNSWGRGFGVNGRFRLSFTDFDRLLREDGDVTVPLGKAALNANPN